MALHGTVTAPILNTDGSEDEVCIDLSTITPRQLKLGVVLRNMLRAHLETVWVHGLNQITVQLSGGTSLGTTSWFHFTSFGAFAESYPAAEDVVFAYLQGHNPDALYSREVAPCLSGFAEEAVNKNGGPASLSGKAKRYLVSCYDAIVYAHKANTLENITVAKNGAIILDHGTFCVHHTQETLHDFYPVVKAVKALYAEGTYPVGQQLTSELDRRGITR